MSSPLLQPDAVTFDCWATLMYEVGPDGRDDSYRRAKGADRRARLLAEYANVDERRAKEALGRAWLEHQVSWHRCVVFAGSHMVDFALSDLGVTLASDERDALVRVLEDDALERQVRAVAGAREALERLAREGVRLALICDTGFSPGRVVRTLLDRAGLLQPLEATIFSDEVGVPKPHPKVFEAALAALGVPASRAVHVGDLRRSDVAGARAFGMGTVRLTAHHDDSSGGAGAGVLDCTVAGCAPPCPRPEADAVADSFESVLRTFGFS